MVTLTSTCPADAAGVTAVIWVGPLTVKQPAPPEGGHAAVTDVAPKSTAVVVKLPTV
jgi:hypothetical protein